MAYPTFQRVLGETNLERKCLFLFGTSQFLLLFASFWWYGRATTNLVYENTRSNCRVLVEKSLIKLHALHWESLPEHRKTLEDNLTELEQISYSWRCLGLDGNSSSSMTLPDGWERATLERLRKAYLRRLDANANSSKSPPRDSDSPAAVPSEDEAAAPIYETYKDESPLFGDRKNSTSTEFDYYQVVRWKPNCTVCHAPLHGVNPQGKSPAELVREMPFRVVKVALPFEITQRAIHRNYAIVLAVAIVTVFLAMLALYAIVRFIIVRPIQHLRQVSEEVEHGNYEARAEIETQDEFEDLAQAYNSMLRHLVEAQQKLQTTNSQLDARVDQLAQVNMQLYEMNRLKSDFLANVSHELRTPLNSIIGFSEVLQGIETLNDKQKRYVMNIRKSGRVLLDMINDILDLAKVESGRMALKPAEFQILPIVQAQTDFVRSLAEEKNIDITVDGATDLPPLVQDQAKVGQIVTNLVSNAIKFTPDGGYVRLVIRAEPPVGELGEGQLPDWLLLSVIDTGVGIAKEDQETIFEKFRQAGAARGDNLTREFSGTGLGLSIVRELCKLLGGSITVESELGRGSTFTVRLPWHIPSDLLQPFEVDTTDTREFSERSRLAARQAVPATPWTATPNNGNVL
ncbi:MAG TPA: HAMP domain-containing sensor histidine kinase [Pirellulaceae bacterium]